MSYLNKCMGYNIEINSTSLMQCLEGCETLSNLFCQNALDSGLAEQPVTRSEKIRTTHSLYTVDLYLEHKQTDRHTVLCNPASCSIRITSCYGLFGQA